MSQSGHYGYPCVTNPNDFSPDEEMSSPQEIEAHKQACKDWGTNKFIPNKGCISSSDEKGNYIHITRTSWGIGINTYLMCDECGEIMKEMIHCWECGGDFCSASCWPKHDKDEC